LYATFSYASTSLFSNASLLSFRAIANSSERQRGALRDRQRERDKERDKELDDTDREIAIEREYMSTAKERMRGREP